MHHCQLKRCFVLPKQKLCSEMNSSDQSFDRDHLVFKITASRSNGFVCSDDFHLLWLLTLTKQAQKPEYSTVILDLTSKW